MTPPPLLIGGALLFWGLYAEMIIPAALCAIIVESPRWTGWRLQISEPEVRRVWLLTCLILLSVMVFSFVELGGLLMFSRASLYSPLIFFPLALVQAFHAKSALEFKTLFLKSKEHLSLTGSRPLAVNWLYLYLILILISTGLQARGPATLGGGLTSLASGSRFYLGAAILLSVALWKFRPRGTSPVLWVVLFLISGAMGVMGNLGIHAAQEIIDREVIQFMMKKMQQNLDPYKTSTAIGRLGELKLYGRIVFRVKQFKGEDDQFLLAQNGYTVYRSPNWFSPRGGFRPIYPEANGWDWRFGPNTDFRQVLEVTRPLENGSGFLPLPINTSFLGNLPAGSLLRNQQGGLLVQSGPEWTKYTIKAGDENNLIGSPTDADLSIPPYLMGILKPALDQLQLNRVPVSTVPEHLRKFFKAGFTYQLKGTGAPEQVDPLDNFLNRTRAGHCEYFATATTLLLRAAGIPARYMVGYSVHERDPVNNQFIVRQRNAHSWALAWIEGEWVEVDTTPPSWIAFENEQASSLEWVGDLFGRLKMALVDWRWFQEKENNGHEPWLLMFTAFIFYLGWKIARRVRFNRKLKTSSQNNTSSQQIKRTPFSRIENYLENKVGPRHPDETYRIWLERVSEEAGNERLQEELERMLNEHYRMRFDPAFDKTDNEKRLQEEVDDWLGRQEDFSGSQSRSSSSIS
ncbi:MAG: transglutaminase domain-containing protein [Candidatus Nitronauta litoralis]|uniref:Transglutaminase domain-containing protein n=1 Tax=Candidatus Nitronauta litoralis TaxID=2705533 RepID=A0A7T0FZX1_9BACT|nr:MAG: transglutaminase domain-containing protein [Candidatus Nitronauta litoralis]